MSDSSETSCNQSISSKYKDVLPTSIELLSSDTSNDVNVVYLSSDDEEDALVQSKNPTKKSDTETICIEDDVKKVDAMKNKVLCDDVETSGQKKHDAAKEIIYLSDDLPSSQSSNSVSKISG